MTPRVGVATAEVFSGGILPDRPELGPVDVLVDRGRILAVEAAGTVDAGTRHELDGAWLLPGFIDAHVHPIHAETLESVGAEAPAGGVTTVLNHFYPRPGEPLAEAVARATAVAARAAADHGFHIRLTPDRLTGADPLVDQLRPLTELRGVVSVKAFLAHADPAVMMTSGGLARVLHAASGFGLPVIVHAEPGEVIATLDELLGSAGSLAEHDRRRAPDLEAAAVSLAAATARATGARLYVAHLSSEPAVDAVQRAAEAGARIRGESCTHYMTLDSGASLGSLGRVTPPLRSSASVAAMRTRATRPGSGIDVLASDHCGYDADEKPLDDFTHAGNGLPGLDSFVPLLLDAAIGGGWLSPADVVRLAARGPAETFGLARKGRIAPGADADLVVVDPAGTTMLLADPPGPATAHSPYAGRRLRGAVHHVVRRGVGLVWEGEDTEAAATSGGIPVERTEPRW